MNYQNYNQSPYTPPYQNKPQPNGMSIASLVLGILGCTICCGYGGLIMGIVGLILGIIGNNKVKTSLGIAGIVVSSVAIFLSIFGAIFFTVFFSEAMYEAYYF